MFQSSEQELSPAGVDLITPADSGLIPPTTIPPSLGKCDRRDMRIAGLPWILACLALAWWGSSQAQDVADNPVLHVSIRELTDANDLVDAYKDQGMVEEDARTGFARLRDGLQASDVAGIVKNANRLRDLFIAERSKATGQSPEQFAAVYAKQIASNDRNRWQKWYAFAECEVIDYGTWAETLVLALARRFLEERGCSEVQSKQQRVNGETDFVLIGAAKQKERVIVVRSNGSGDLVRTLGCPDLHCRLVKTGTRTEGMIIARQSFAVLAHPESETNNFILADLSRRLVIGPKMDSDAGRLLRELLGSTCAWTFDSTGPLGGVHDLESSILNNKSGLYLAPFPLAFRSHAKVIAINTDRHAGGVRPTPLTASDGSYPLTFDLLVKGSAVVESEFGKFLATEPARQVIRRLGFGLPPLSH